MPEPQLALLTRDTETGRIAASYLTERFPALRIVAEEPISRASLLRGRARRLGIATVVGQLGFIVVQRAQELASRNRIAEIERQFHLVGAWPQGHAIGTCLCSLIG